VNRTNFFEKLKKKFNNSNNNIQNINNSNLINNNTNLNLFENNNNNNIKTITVKKCN
jgi:hypothetical protein